MLQGKNGTLTPRGGVTDVDATRIFDSYLIILMESWVTYDGWEPAPHSRFPQFRSENELERYSDRRANAHKGAEATLTSSALVASRCVFD